MGRSIKPKYVLTISTPGYHNTPSGWDVRGRYGMKGNGAPTDANLAKYMEAFIASMEPGKPNAHLASQAKPYKPVSAHVWVNDGQYDVALASWKAV